MEQQIQNFCNWLSQTPISNVIQTVSWIIPMTQSAHIIAITIVVGSVLMMDMKLLGVVGGGTTVGEMNRRFLPWVWTCLVLLLLTGTILTIAEPGRELINNAFRLKMLLIIAAIAVTLTFQEIVRRGAVHWDGQGGSAWWGRLLALASMGIWIGIMICGRWIAYVDHQ